MRHRLYDLRTMISPWVMDHDLWTHATEVRNVSYRMNHTVWFIQNKFLLAFPSHWIFLVAKARPLSPEAKAERDAKRARKQENYLNRIDNKEEQAEKAEARFQKQREKMAKQARKAIRQERKNKKYQGTPFGSKVEKKQEKSEKKAASLKEQETREDEQIQKQLKKEGKQTKKDQNSGFFNLRTIYQGHFGLKISQLTYIDHIY